MFANPKNAKEHNRKIKKIQEEMRDFFNRGQQVKIYHGSTNSTRQQKFEKDKIIDISFLNQVLEVNANECYVLVEANVPMDTLVEETLRYNLIPPIVPEFPGITIGGAIQGGAGESSSFKYDLEDVCLEYEMVLGNGELFIVSPEKNADLFYGTACSYGTLGIITLVKLRLVPAKEYVTLTYFPTQNFEEAVTLIEKKSKEPVDFIDGILFDKNQGIVMVGVFSNKKADLPIVTFRGRADDWFYLHAQKCLAKKEPHEELIPIRDYVFRYDRGAFWVGRYAFEYFKMPFNKITRYVFNKFFLTRNLYKTLHATNISQEYIVQDLCMPKKTIGTLLNHIHETMGIYPLWLCPFRPEKKSVFSPTYLDTDLVINVGVWGKIKGKEVSNFIEVNRELEKWVENLGGRKVLYAHAYYTPDEFWNIYNKNWYDTLRKKYHAVKVFPNMYDKVKVSERYKPSILKGLWRAKKLSKLPIA